MPIDGEIRGWQLMTGESLNHQEAIQPRSAWRWLRNAALDSRYMADPEWLIGLGRLVTAAFAAIAIYFDPTQPTKLADEARLITLVYLGFALLALVPIQRPIESRLHILTHGVDIVVIAWLLHLTDELTSPFFAFFHFTLFACTIRWGLTGALLGAVVLEVMLLLVGLPDLEDGQSELNVMIMRSGYFLVAAFMLGYFGAYRNRSRHRLERLAAWPSVHLWQGDRAWLKDIVGHARTVLGAGRVAVIYEDVDLLTGTVATCADEQLSVRDFDDTAEWALIANSLEAFKDARSSGCAEMLVRRLGEAIGEDGLTSPRLDNFCVAPFFGTRYRGYLVVLNAKYRHEEIESLASIVASRISYELERAALIREIASNVRTEERVRLARNLHDSVLQDLTAASLRLKAAGRQVPEEAQPLLADVAAIIAGQQRQIRRFVEGKGAIEDGNGLPHALDRHVRQLSRQWGCEIHLTTTPVDLRVSAAMSDNIAQIISEATSNAVRHGAATRIDLVISTGDGRLQLGIADNGTGIVGPQEPGMSEPHSLSARVADLAGRLCVVRDRPGFAMFIELPST